MAVMHLNRRSFLGSLGVASLSAAPARPNVVIILADDLGYGDLSCYGAEKIKTANADRLAKEGRRFTQAYTPSSVCSPTRYALLTGRYCWRTSLKKEVLNFNAPLHIEPERLTLPSLFKKHGYTSAAIGKWHLGYGTRPQVEWNQPLRPGPLELGFDYHFAVPSNHGDLTRAFVRNDALIDREPNVAYVPGKKNQPPQGLKQKRVDDRVNLRLAAEATEFIERSAAKPFFLYFTPVAVHNPVTPNRQFRGKSEAGLYGDYVLELDYAIGQVLGTLDRLKLADNTLVIVTSDNGGVVMSRVPRGPAGLTAGLAAAQDLNLEDDEGQAVSAHYRQAQMEAEQAGHQIVGSLRGRKHSIYEGGFRVPYLVRWPGHVPAGTTCDEIVSHADLLATCVGLLGDRLPAKFGEDSYNILPALLGQKLKRPIREAVVVHSAEGLFAIRQGPWKLIEAPADPAEVRPTWRTEATNQLYHLGNDPQETKNVWEANPAVVARLKGLLDRYRTSGRSGPSR